MSTARLFGPSGVLKDIEGALLPLRALRFVNSAIEWGEALRRREGLKTHARDTSLVIYIKRCAPVSVAEIAAVYGYSHQYATQRISRLMKSGLVTRRDDPKDSRRKVVALTRKGREEVPQLIALERRVQRLYRDMEAELGIDLAAVLEALQARIETQILRG